MGNFSAQLRQVLRRLGRAPLFTIITIITLAAGIGANAVIFGVLDGVLLKPLPYPKPNELVGVWLTAPGINITNLNMSPSTYFILRDQNQSFQDIGLYTGDSASVTGTGEPEQIFGIDVTDGVLPLLGVTPALGRTFNRADCVPGAPDTIVLTYGYWQHKLGGDRSVIGRTLTVDGNPRQIVGVVPKNFVFLDNPDIQFFLPAPIRSCQTQARQLQLRRRGAPEARRHHRTRQFRCRTSASRRHPFLPASRRFQPQIIR